MSPNRQDRETADRLAARINHGGSGGLVDEQLELGVDPDVLAQNRMAGAAREPARDGGGNYGTAQAPMGIDRGEPGAHPEMEDGRK